MKTKTKPHRSLLRRVHFGPMIGLAVLACWGWSVVWLIERAHRHDHTLDALEWLAELDGSVPEPVREKWIISYHPIVLGGQDPYQHVYFNDYHPPLTYPPGLGFIQERWVHQAKVTWAETRHGLLAPTRAQCTLFAHHYSYPDGGDSTTHQYIERGTPKRISDRMVDGLQGAFEHYSGFDLPPALFRSLRVRGDAPSPTTPIHDFGVNWHIPATHTERVLWWGYALNVFLIAGPVWVALCAREMSRYRPWRAYYRKSWQCWTCGYDLRQTPESDACPECGWMPIDNAYGRHHSA